MALTVTSAKPYAPRYRTGPGSVPFVQYTLNTLSRLGTDSVSRVVELHNRPPERMPGIDIQSLVRSPYGEVGFGRSPTTFNIDPFSGFEKKTLGTTETLNHLGREIRRVFKPKSE